jgi:uncharacterized membrane protein YphA (DoxX/SURF4 family)
MENFMAFRDALALHVAPLPLRVILAVTFVWAGLGKVTQSMEVQGESAARLANMGILATTRAEPSLPLQPDTKVAPPQDPLQAPGAAGGGGAKPSPQQESPAGLLPPLLVMAQDSKSGGTQSGGTQPSAPAPSYTAADFPRPASVLRVNGLALLIHSAAFPAPRPDGSAAMVLWPQAVATGMWPVILAWSVALSEFIGGVLIFVGCFTRLSALSLVGVMAGAIWLTGIGPALQAGTTQLGFLPNHATFDVAAWKDLLWQCVLAMACLTLAMLGSGALALDRVLFVRGGAAAEAPDRGTPA